MRFIKIKTKSKRWSVGIYPFMFLGIYANDDTIRHEKIHFKQQLELLIIPFYILYLIFNIKYGYRDNPFEKEAYTYSLKPKERKPYGWVKFIN